MKIKRLVIISFVILFIWNIFLTMKVLNEDVQSNRVIINEIELTGFSTDLTKVVEEVSSSICTIRSEKGLSSGFVYHQENDKTYILTSYHGIFDSHNIQVLFDNDIGVNANIYAYDSASDLCLLELDFPYTVKKMELTDARLLKAGELAIAMGTPISLEYSNTPSLVMISNGSRIIDTPLVGQTSTYYRNLIQFSSTLNKGNSGGPLINMDGQVIGMCTLSYELKDGEGIYFATSSNEMKLVAEKMLNGENYHKHHFGIKGLSIQAMENYKKVALALPIDVVEGYYVSTIRSNQVAAMAGLMHDDILLRVNGQKILDDYDLMEAQYEDSQEFVFEVLREGEVIELKGYIND